MIVIKLVEEYLLVMQKTTIFFMTQLVGMSYTIMSERTYLTPFLIDFSLRPNFYIRYF